MGKIGHVLWMSLLELTVLFGVTEPVSGNKQPPDKIPYLCANTDICNSEGTEWQYCDFEQQRCRYCSEKEIFCLTPDIPKNCSTFCKESLLEREREKGCPFLGPIEHGKHNGSESGHNYGDKIYLDCDTGYECDESCVSTCSDFGLYSQQLKCRAKRCPRFSTSEDLKLTPDKPEYEIGNSFHFVCNDGSTPEEESKATCTKNGTWSINKMPNCEKEKDTVMWIGIVAALVVVIVAMSILLCILFCKDKQYPCKRNLDSEKPATDKDSEEPLLQTTNDTSETIKLLPVKSSNNEPEKSITRSHTDSMILEDESGQKRISKSSNASTSDMTEHGDGLRSTSPTPAGSEDSGFSNGNGQKKGNGSPNFTFNFDLNTSLVCNNLQGNISNQLCNLKTDNEAKSSTADDKKPDCKQPRPNDKFSTEESGENDADVCRRELDDPGSVTLSSDGAINAEGTSKKQLHLSNSEQSLGFPVSEQSKDLPESQYHNQPRGGNDKAIFMIGNKTVHAEDVLPSRKDQDSSHVLHTQAEGDEGKLRTMAINQNSDNQDDILSQHQRNIIVDPTPS